MGMKRGAFESVKLGNVAKSANSTYFERNSIASGLAAHARGIAYLAEGYKGIGDVLGSVSDLMDKLGNEATKAYGASKACAEQYDAANTNLQAVKTEMQEKVARGETLTQADRDRLSAANSEYNDSSKRKQANSYWQLNFKGDYQRQTDDELIESITHEKEDQVLMDEDDKFYEEIEKENREGK